MLIHWYLKVICLEFFLRFLPLRKYDFNPLEPGVFFRGYRKAKPGYNGLLFQFKCFIKKKYLTTFIIFFTTNFQYWWLIKCKTNHCVKSAGIRNYYGPYCPIFGVRMQKNKEQNNSKYGHLSHSEQVVIS